MTVMPRRIDLPETIPIFPLPGALLLPRARLPLHIFEPRYLAMVEACMATRERLIGMIQPRAVPEGEPPRLHAIGCAGRLTAFSETEDGRYMITLTGVSRFRVLGEVTAGTPFRQVRAGWADFPRDQGPAETDAGLDRPAFLDLLRRYFAAVELSTEWNSLREAEDELLINALSMLCPFPPEERQALLEAPSLTTRRETLVMLMEFALRARAGGSPEPRN
jgi:Lon protease-like protein